jgi:hypothetical protein
MLYVLGYTVSTLNVSSSRSKNFDSKLQNLVIHTQLPDDDPVRVETV